MITVIFSDYKIAIKPIVFHSSLILFFTSVELGNNSERNERK